MNPLHLLPRLDRLILGEIIGPFVGSTALFTGLIFAGGDLVRSAQFLQQGEGVFLVVQLLLYTLPGILALTFPMALLLGTLLGFGRLSGDSEIIALTAAGVSFERIMLPVAVFGLLISFVGYWFNQEVVPTANSQRQALIEKVKKKGGANLVGLNAITFDLRDGDNLTHIHVEGGVDPQTATLRDVSVEQWRGGTLQSVFFAPRADWVAGSKNWRLQQASVITQVTGPTTSVSHLDALQSREVTLDTPTNLAYLNRPVIEVTTSGLRERSRVLRAGGDFAAAREAEVEVAQRVALPFASLMFALIAAPLGVGPTRGGKGVGFGLSVLITFVYWMSLQVVAILGRGGLLPPALALMLPNAACFAVAVFLVRRVMR